MLWHFEKNRVFVAFFSASSYAFFALLCALITTSESVKVTHKPLNFSSTFESSTAFIVFVFLSLLYHRLLVKLRVAR